MREKVCVFVFVLAFAACSGGTPQTVAVAQLFGDYSLATFQEDDTGTPVARPVATDFSVPGFVGVDYNFDGVAEEELPYELDASGTITVNGVPVGAVSPDGQIMIGGNLNPDEPRAGITIGAAAKTARGIGNFALAGKYVACSLGGDAATGEYWTRRQLCTADGIESLLWGVLAHSDGETGSATFDYAALDGNIQMGGYVGTLTITGHAAMFSLPGAPVPEFMVLIRKTAHNSVATISGGYSGFSFTREAGLTLTAKVAFTADGAGTGSLTEQRSDGSSGSEFFSYDILDDGVMIFDNDLNGIVSGDGNFFAAVDTDNTDGKISFLLAVRQGG